MRVQILSDLHNEFGLFEYDFSNIDLLILAGLRKMDMYMNLLIIILGKQESFVIQKDIRMNLILITNQNL